METKEEILKALRTIVKKLQPDFDLQKIKLEHPNELVNGDFSSNIAMQLTKFLKKPPLEIAEEIVEELKKDKNIAKQVKKNEVAKPGFINFHLSPDFFANTISSIDKSFGKNDLLKKQKAIVEYTDPNPFKILHIGHLMSNTVGESISRVIEWSGAQTKRACYQGDVGMHVAKSLWGLLDLGVQNFPKETDLSEQVAYLGKAYVHGSTVYKEGTDEQKEAIKQLNKTIYEKSDKKINELYGWGRQVSLDYFETQYQKLGTKFDYYFFESEVAETGLKVVKSFLKKGVFEESKGAIVFPGEKYGLHTRVFLNSEGLPTYETKELGLAKMKYDKYPYDLSVVVTGNEINQYFQVLLKVMSFVFPQLEKKTKHVGHGMLRLPSGKMSSRTGTVVSAESLISQALEKAKVKFGEAGSGFAGKGEESVYLQVAIGAIKFSILSQSAGSDIIFDFEKSLSFEGDSGPYLQYTRARCLSVLRKGEKEKLKVSKKLPENWETTEVERLLYKFPEVVARSLNDYSTHHIANYLIDTARGFNSFYGNTKILDAEDGATGYKLNITKAIAQVIENGLWLLGIEAPEKM